MWPLLFFLNKLKKKKKKKKETRNVIPIISFLLEFRVMSCHVTCLISGLSRGKVWDRVNDGGLLSEHSLPMALSECRGTVMSGRKRPIL